jgi:hypothetical protein
MSIGDSLNLGVDQAVQAVKSAAGIVTANQNNKTLFTPLPWESSNIQSKFFQSIQIDPSRWDQLFPYRLLVIDSNTNSVVTGTNSPAVGSGAAVGAGAGAGQKVGLNPPPKITVSTGTSSVLVSFENTSGWIMQLPISPQQLTITSPYSIQTSLTLRGVLEEHSGMRMKMINAQGTMGVWPYRSSVTKPSGTPGILQSVFGGTINALGSVVNQVSNVINTATTGHPANKPASLRPETSDFGAQSTGYYQALKLEQFLEQYVEAKRNPANASWRLVFDIPKQNQSYVVTPVIYDWVQNATKPMEITYKFQLKPWRRINLSQTVTETSPNNQPISPGILQRILNTINQAQQLLSASLNLLGAVRSDIDAPLNILRQTVLFVKGLAGVVTTAADLPTQIAADYSSAIASAITALSSSILTNVSDPTTVASVKAIVAASNQTEGLTMSAVSAGQLGTNAATYQSLNPVQNILSNPNANFTLFDQVPLNSLSLNNAQNAVVQKLINAASTTTVAQLKSYRASILTLALQLSNVFGTGSAYYNNLFQLPPPSVSYIPITIDQYTILTSLYNTLSCYDILTASTQVDDFAIESSMEYVAGLADTAGIAFNVPTSKVLVPVPFGLTIEAIAARYLGDPELWLEIAVLNGLQEPYIDEDGFQVPLLSNAIARQVVVGSNDDLFIGQTVIVSGAGQIPSPRSIITIETLSSTSYLITLDGLPNLENFTVAAGSYLQAYLPGTVNSQQKVFIPSDLPVPDVSNIVPPSATSGDSLTGLSKVDWLLTDSGDLAVNNYGDFRYASGITNIIQALRIKFGTQANTVLTHPNFGLNVRVGSISSELQLQDLYNSINEMVQQDPRFQVVSNLQIIQNGPVLGISLGVQLPNQTGVFPVSFALTSST